MNILRGEACKERERESMESTAEAFSPAKLPEALEWRPWSRRLLKWREKPSLAAGGRWLLKDTPTGAPGAGPARRHPAGAVAERRRKGREVTWLGPGWRQQVSHPTPKTDESVFGEESFWGTNWKRLYLCGEDMGSKDYFYICNGGCYDESFLKRGLCT